MVEEYPWLDKFICEDRMRLVRSLIRTDSSILDLGCGYSYLKEFVEYGKYVGVDKYDFGNNLVCNFEDGFLILDAKFDYVVVQGLLEYLKDVEEFLNEIKNYGDTIRVTYNKSSPNSKYNVPDRINFFDFEYLEKMFSLIGLKILNVVYCKNFRIYQLV